MREISNRPDKSRERRNNAEGDAVAVPLFRSLYVYARFIVAVLLFPATSAKTVSGSSFSIPDNLSRRNIRIIANNARGALIARRQQSTAIMESAPF